MLRVDTLQLRMCATASGVPCPCAQRPDSRAAPPNIKTPDSSQTSARDYSTNMDQIDKAIAASVFFGGVGREARVSGAGDRAAQLGALGLKMEASDV